MNVRYWICPNCETRNASTLEKCEVCDELNPFFVYPVAIDYCKIYPDNVKYGNDCTISWSAKNVDKVIIKGIEHHKGQGTYTYTPKESENIDITFVGKDGKTIHRSIDVSVKKSHKGRVLRIIICLGIITILMTNISPIKGIIANSYINKASVDNIEALEKANNILQNIKDEDTRRDIKTKLNNKTMCIRNEIESAPHIVVELQENQDKLQKIDKILHS